MRHVLLTPCAAGHLTILLAVQVGVVYPRVGQDVVQVLKPGVQLVRGDVHAGVAVACSVAAAPSALSSGLVVHRLAELSSPVCFQAGRGCWLRQGPTPLAFGRRGPWPRAPAKPKRTMLRGMGRCSWATGAKPRYSPSDAAPRKACGGRRSQVITMQRLRPFPMGSYSSTTHLSILEVHMLQGPEPRQLGALP
jgi:hypothetical protein